MNHASARPDTVPYRVAKFVRRNRGSVVSGLLVAIGLVVTSAFAVSQMQAARAQRDRALEEAKRANAQADLTQYILDDKLSTLSPGAESQRLDRARQFLAARFRNDPLLAARLLIDVSGRYIDIGDFRTAADVAIEAETIGHRFDDADILGQLACLSESCWALSRLDRGEPQQAEPAILEAARKAEQGGISYQASLLRASAVIDALARADLATAEARRAELLPDEERRFAANEKGVEVVRLLLVSARLDIARNRPDEALKSLERAGVLIASRRQRSNPDARELEVLRSSALLAKQRYVEAEQHAQAALELARISAVDPKSSSWIGEALVLRARAEAGSGRKVAPATAQEALTHLVPNLDPTHPLIAQAREIASVPHPKPPSFGISAMLPCIGYFAVVAVCLVQIAHDATASALLVGAVGFSIFIGPVILALGKAILDEWVDPRKAGPGGWKSPSLKPANRFRLSGSTSSLTVAAVPAPSGRLTLPVTDG